jgi:NADH-quinone oxidoreductase subunit M
MREMGGLWARLPFLPPIAMFFSAAALGLPGMGNFVGEFLILVGSFPVNPVITIVSASGLILAAVYSLMMMQRAFFGPAKSDEKLRDLNVREMTTMLSLMALILFMGLYPQPILDVTRATMAGVQAVYATGLVPVPATVVGVLP